MSLADEVSGRPRHWTYPRVLEALGDEAAEFEEQLSNPDAVPYRIWQALLKRHIDVSSRPIYEWCEKARRESR